MNIREIYEDVHKQFHMEYGNKNTTRQDFSEFCLRNFNVIFE
jgi:hypothetical protein